MEMVRSLLAILIFAGEAEVAAPTDSTCESYANELTNLDVVATIGTDLDYATNTLVAADVGQLDVGDRFTFVGGGGASHGVEI